MRRTTTFVPLLFALFLLAPAAAAVTIEPVPGLARPKVDEAGIAASEHYFAYHRRQDGRLVSKVRSRETGDEVRINDTANMAVQGFVPGTDIVVAVRQTQNDSSIHVYDPATDELTLVPEVNSGFEWEYSAQVSATYVLYVRTIVGTAYVILHDRATDEEAQLASWSTERFDVRADAVGDRYATWTVCGARTCRVFLHDAELDATNLVPSSARNVPQYGSSIDEADDTFYLVRSGFGCGDHVRFRAGTLSDITEPSSVFAALPDGVDIGSSNVHHFHEPVADRDDLYFTRFRCRSERADAFVITDVP